MDRVDLRGKKNTVYLNDKASAKKVWNAKRHCQHEGKAFNPIDLMNEGIYVEFATFYEIYYRYENRLRIPERLKDAKITYPIEFHEFLKVYMKADELAYVYKAVEHQPFTQRWMNLMGVALNTIVAKVWSHTIAAGFFETQKGLSKDFMRVVVFSRPADRDIFLNSWYSRISKTRSKGDFEALFQPTEKKDARILIRGLDMIIERLNFLVQNIDSSCFINSAYLTLECQPGLLI